MNLQHVKVGDYLFCVFYKDQLPTIHKCTKISTSRVWVGDQWVNARDGKSDITVDFRRRGSFQMEFWCPTPEELQSYEEFQKRVRKRWLIICNIRSHYDSTFNELDLEALEKIQEILINPKNKAPKSFNST